MHFTAVIVLLLFCFFPGVKGCHAPYRGINQLYPMTLNDTIAGITLLKVKVKLMRQAVQQNWRTLDIFMAARGRTSAITKAKYSIYILDSSDNVSLECYDFRQQVNAMSHAKAPSTLSLSSLWKAIMSSYRWTFLLVS